MLVTVQSRLQVLFLWLRKQHPWQFLVWGGLAWLWQYIQIPYGFSLQDDFWLWYGVQRLAAGEVPIRDFQSYDAGRYLLTIMLSFGQDTLYGVRIAQASIGAAVVAAGIWLLLQRKSDLSIVLVILSAAVLSLWLFPRHKYYDIAISVVNVLFVWHLLTKQTRTLRLIIGSMVVLSLLINRNHAIYLVLVLGLWIVAQCVILPSTQRLTWRQFIEILLGGMVAVAGVFLTATLIPGYVDAYYRHNILIFLEAGTTNLALPIV